MPEVREKETANFRRTIRLNDEVYNDIAKIAERENISIAAVMRKYIDRGLSAAYYEENDSRVRQMIREEIEAIFDTYMNRLIKIILKGTKASAASLYALMNLLAANMMSESSAEDLLANAFKQASVYMKQKEKSDVDYKNEAKEFLHASQSISKKDDN